jgi:hypothetical protein
VRGGDKLEATLQVKRMMACLFRFVQPLLFCVVDGREPCTGMRDTPAEAAAFIKTG